MNRRKVITILAGLLPCAIVARMFGEKDLHATPTPNPAYRSVPYSAMMYSPTTGFHTEIQERGESFTIEGERIPPHFRAIITDCNKNMKCALQSPFFEEGDKEAYRRALDCVYRMVADVIRRRQFPKDTLIYDTEITVNGVKIKNPRYPNE